jgi:hypothetical protein
MTARQFLSWFYGLLASRHGVDVVDEYVDPPPEVDELNVRRMANVVAAIELGAEVG